MVMIEKNEGQASEVNQSMLTNSPSQKESRTLTASQFNSSDLVHMGFLSSSFSSSLSDGGDGSMGHCNHDFSAWKRRRMSTTFSNSLANAPSAKSIANPRLKRVALGLNCKPARETYQTPNFTHHPHSSQLHCRTIVLATRGEMKTFEFHQQLLFFWVELCQGYILCLKK